MTSSLLNPRMTNLNKISSENKIKFWLNIKLCFHSTTREAIGYDKIKRDNTFFVTALFSNIMQFFSQVFLFIRFLSHKFLPSWQGGDSYVRLQLN